MRKSAFVIIVCLISCLTSLSLSAQVGKNYPAMSGDNLLNKSVTLPSRGKVTLVALAYSPKSEEYLKDWRKPLFNLFIQAPGTNLFAFEPYDAHVKFVVLLTGAKKVAGGKVKTRLEEEVQDHWKEHIVVIKGKSVNNYVDLNLSKGKVEKTYPYFFLLDEKGKITYATSGEYTKDKERELRDKLEELLGDNQVDN